MKLKNIINISIKNIKSNKMRSILTMLGLVVGIASVIVLVGIGSGATSDVTSQIKTLGTDILSVSITSSDYSFKYDSINDFLDISNVSAVAPYKQVSSTVNRGTTTSSNTSIIATDSNYLSVTNGELLSGRDISIIDIENKSKVCIIGSETAQTFFSLAEPLGQTIKLDGDNYTVIGVLKEDGTTDSMLIIPLTTATYLNVSKEVNNLYLKVSNEDYIDETKNLIENHVRSTLQISTDYFTVTSSSSILEAMESITNTLSLLLGGIASISLVVGGIGVMNVMLVSVSERTKEIGIRKSLGAKRSDILFQFLIESLLLCLIGGFIGILFGIGIGNIAELFSFSFTCKTSIIILSVSVSAFIGLVFGIFPAYKASLLNPIDALRSE